jgi:hypothetical protein
MKKLVLYVLIFTCSFCKAQNLVPNPSFEIHSGCPQFLGDLDLATGWTSFRESPDYYNACAPATGLGVPQNLFGHQAAFDGDAYIGLACFHSFGDSLREYAGIQLTQPLTTGTKYYVSFYVSLADSLGGDCATNKIGIKFSTQQFSFNDPMPVDNYSHVFSQSIISDMLNWTPVFGSFIADSAYNYAVIGNFFTDAFTDSANCFPSYSYYFVDNICVSTDSLNCPVVTSVHEYNQSNLCSVYLNSENELNITSINNIVRQVEIYNIAGQAILTDNNIVLQNKKISLKNFSKGVYICKIYSNNKLYVKKIIINN